MSTRSETDIDIQREHGRHSLSMVKDGCSNELRFLITILNQMDTTAFLRLSSS